MRISATGNRHGEHGLTLVELLIAIAIIGLLAGVVVLTLPSDPDDAETEAYALARQMKGAYELAIVRGTVIGLEVAPASYRFLQREADSWEPLDRAENSARALPEAIRLSVNRTDLVSPGTAGGRQGFFVDEEPEKETPEPEPEILFRPTGEVTPLDITIQGENAVWRISQSSGAKIRVQRVDE